MTEVVLWTAVGCWVAAVLFTFWRDTVQWKRLYELMAESRTDRQELLDRLMARDFVQFKQAELVERHVDNVAKTEGSAELRPEDLDLSDVGL